MKIAIDITSAEKDPDGIGQYTINLLNALFELDRVNEYVLYSLKPFNTSKENVVIKRPSLLPFKGIIWMMRVAKHAKKTGVDILISPSNHLFSILFNKTIPVIHDLTPVFHPNFFPKKGAFFYKMGIKYWIPKSWRIIATTNTIKKELSEYANIPSEKIAVVYPSLNKNIIDEAVDFVDLGLPEKYLLSISTLSPKKNIPALLEGFKNYLTTSGDNETKLVIIGRKGWYYSEIFKKLDLLGLNDKVIFPGYVEDRFIGKILKNADAFILLSTHEGFGMPILEALSFDLPVVASDIQVFKECFGESITYVDPKDPSAVGNAIKDEFNGHVSPKFDKTKYSWEKSAQELLNVINS